jgi:hypothetical protein
MTSFPEVNSRNRPADTALHNAAILLDQPIPRNTKLFATVDDALALQYLSNIWELRPDLETISSTQVAEHLGSAGHVYSTWLAAPTLISEISDEMPVILHSFSADWVVLMTEPSGAGQNSPDTPPPPQSIVDLPVVTGLRLIGYSIQPSPTGQPVNRMRLPAIDVVLYWCLDNGKWPEGLAVSLRPTQQGAYLTDAQGNIVHVDHNRPVRGLVTPQDHDTRTVVTDAFRLPLADSFLTDIDGVAVVAYTSGPHGFENVADLRLPIVQ